MPRLKSSKKRMRQTKVKTINNRTQRSQLRTAIKKVRQTTEPAARSVAMADAVKLIDRAGRKNIIHHNAAARLKSRLALAKV